MGEAALSSLSENFMYTLLYQNSVSVNSEPQVWEIRQTFNRDDNFLLPENVVTIMASSTRQICAVHNVS